MILDQFNYVSKRCFWLLTNYEIQFLLTCHLHFESDNIGKKKTSHTPEMSILFDSVSDYLFCSSCFVSMVRTRRQETNPVICKWFLAQNVPSPSQEFKT